MRQSAIMLVVVRWKDLHVHARQWNSRSSLSAFIEMKKNCGRRISVLVQHCGLPMFQNEIIPVSLTQNILLLFLCFPLFYCDASIF